MVYLFDDTASLYGQTSQLKRSLLRLLATYKTTPDVRVAALRHGGVSRGVQIYSEIYNNLGGRRGGPYMFSPDPSKRSGNLLKNPQEPFKAPSQLSRTLIKNAIDDLSLGGDAEFLYPAINLAGRMIKQECPENVNLAVKPWCKRKIIVVLGDGEPGLASGDYYPDVGKSPGELPEVLLDRINRNDVKLHTLCIGDACLVNIARETDTLRRLHFFPVACPPTRNSYVCLGFRGGDLMRELAEYTGGKYHGYVPPP